MIAANGATVRFLASRGFASIRRVVAAPKRWDRLCELVETYGAHLPPTPDSLALEKFLQAQKAHDALRFPDLSLAVVKLLGAGEYVAEPPDDPFPDHFGLAARDYTHSTAPNRRYPDLITQRLLKAALAGQPTPYTLAELTALAEHCTLQEDDINKVERQANKTAVALLLSGQIGQRHEGLVTGASSKGTWVRLLDIPVEGRLASGYAGLDVGDRVRVELDAVNVEKGYIDFRRRK
jgi:exoribonuclease-2